MLIASAVEAKADTPARPYTEILFLPPRNLTQEKWTGPKLGAENPEAPKITGFDHVEDMGQLPNEVAQYVGAARPAVYTDVASHGETSPSTAPLAFLKRLNAYLCFQDVKPMISSLRTTKDAGEMALIRKAVDASVAAHFAAFKAVKPEHQRARDLRPHAIRVGQARLRARGLRAHRGLGLLSRPCCTTRTTTTS